MGEDEFKYGEQYSAFANGKHIFRNLLSAFPKRQFKLHQQINSHSIIKLICMKRIGLIIALLISVTIGATKKRASQSKPGASRMYGTSDFFFSSEVAVPRERTTAATATLPRD